RAAAATRAGDRGTRPGAAPQAVRRSSHRGAGDRLRRGAVGAYLGARLQSSGRLRPAGGVLPPLNIGRLPLVNPASPQFGRGGGGKPWLNALRSARSGTTGACLSSPGRSSRLGRQLRPSVA